MGSRKQKISYFYDSDYAGFYYGADHPMKPQRMCMAHELILGYGLHERLDIYVSPPPACPRRFCTRPVPAALPHCTHTLPSPGVACLQRPRRAQYDELTAFHGKDYINVLRTTTPEQQRAHWEHYIQYGLEQDSPVFPGLFDFCRLYAGASLGEARALQPEPGTLPASRPGTQSPTQPGTLPASQPDTRTRPSALARRGRRAAQLGAV